MGKNRRKDHVRHQSNGNAASGSPGPAAIAPTQQVAETPQEVIQRAEETALTDASEEDLEVLASPNNTVPPTDGLDQLVSRAATAITVLDQQRRRYEEKSSALANREDAVERRTNELKTEAENVRRERDGVASEKSVLTKQQQALNEREAQVKALELEAESGFTGRFKQWLSGFDDQRAALQKEIDDLRKEAINVRLECDSARRTAHDQLRAELDEMRRHEVEILRDERQRVEGDLGEVRRNLEIDQRLLAAEKGTLRNEQRKLLAEKEVLAENEKRFQTRVERLAAARVEELGCQLSERDEQLKAARADRQRLVETLTRRQEADLQFGERSPEEVLDALNTLAREREDLQRRLAVVPSSQTIDRLRQLEEEREQFQTERVALLDENRSLKTRMARAEIAVTEVESLRDQKATLETSRNLLEAALRELRSDVNERIKRSDGRCPFPTSAEMDADEELQTVPATRESIPNLARFVEDLRHRIADDRETDKRLYYSERDLRCFLGGLAMSRLYLLQGISGTGKTSLPVAFARAIGAGCKVIEIQAGWRDRQDLLGHYNAFERKFYESEFLLALYRAGCPRFERLPFIVVLDEMNLSHPEQYFAEFLSKLEQEPRQRRVELTTEAVEPAPRLFQEGRKLPLPGNVWFVGTANHDETTKDFAPKTYDRAHVMELPRHPGAFEVRPLQDQDPLALHALESAFDSARVQYRGIAGTAYVSLTKALGETLQRRFGVGWGNRLERQIQDYVPVVRACGGSMGEALDHVIATKLIRKLRNRHDNRPEHVKELMDDLRSGLETVDVQWFKDTDPRDIRSLAMLNDEYEKLGGDGDE